MRPKEKFFISSWRKAETEDYYLIVNFIPWLFWLQDSDTEAFITPLYKLQFQSFILEKTSEVCILYKNAVIIDFGFYSFILYLYFKELSFESLY